MPLDCDYEFGRASVSRGYLRQEQLEECLEVLIAFERVGSEKRLWEVVARKGYMTPGEISEMRRHADSSKAARPAAAAPRPATPRPEESDSGLAQWDIAPDTALIPVSDRWSQLRVDPLSVPPPPEDGTRRYRSGDLKATVIRGPLKGASHVLAGERLVIGRDASADFVLDDTSVSRFHAEIRFGAPQVIIRDLKSRNGIAVNGQKVEESVLAPGMNLRIGRCQLLIEEVAPKASAK